MLYHQLYAKREKEGPKKGIYLIRWDLKAGEGEASLISSEVLACECWMSCSDQFKVPLDTCTRHNCSSWAGFLAVGSGHFISLCVCLEHRTVQAKLKTVLSIQRENIQIVFKHGANVIALCFFCFVFFLFNKFLGKSQALGQGSQLASN